MLTMLCVALICAGAYAAGSTDEEEELAELNAGVWPLQVSRDGQWLVYLDEQGDLIRRRADGTGKAAQRLAVPHSTYALSASRTATKVALLTSQGCIGVAVFTGHVPSLQWLPDKLYCNNGDEPSQCPPDMADDPRARGAGFSQGFAVALSADGARLAMQGPQGVRIVDVARMEVVQELPISSAMHLRFVDEGRKLFAVSAVMGEHWEAPPDGSDMQFSVWDLARGELFQLHGTGTRGALTRHDLLWSFSEATGLLWAQRADGQRWLPETAPGAAPQRVPPRPYAIRLKQCSPFPARALQFPLRDGADWLEFAADPRGRWVAAVDVLEEPGARRSRLQVWDARTGTLLATRHYEGVLRSLTPTADGTAVYGTLSAPMPGAQDYERRYRSLGVERFEIDRSVLSLAAEPPAGWPSARCPIEGEEKNARLVEQRLHRMATVFDLPLTDLVQEQRRAAESVPAEDACTDAFSASWGQSRDGAIWIDRWSHLERIDPSTGQVASRVATPRSATVCSLVSFVRQQFLSWQGDTVAVRDFDTGGHVGASRVLAVQPGWRVESAMWLTGGRVGVRWVDERLMRKAEAEGDVGTARAVIYDPNKPSSAQPLKEVAGKVAQGGSVFEAEEGGWYSVFEADADQAALDDERRLASVAPFVWERSLFGSVRARRREADGRMGPIVLWDRLHAASRAVTGDAPPDRVIGLGGSVGLLQSGRSLTVYDAATRSRVARLTVEDAANLADMAWNPRSRLLLVALSYGSIEWLRGVRLAH